MGQDQAGKTVGIRYPGGHIKIHIQFCTSGIYFKMGDFDLSKVGRNECRKKAK